MVRFFAVTALVAICGYICTVYIYCVQHLRSGSLFLSPLFCLLVSHVAMCVRYSLDAGKDAYGDLNETKVLDKLHFVSVCHIKMAVSRDCLEICLFH